MKLPPQTKCKIICKVSGASVLKTAPRILGLARDMGVKSQPKNNALKSSAGVSLHETICHSWARSSLVHCWSVSACCCFRLPTGEAHSSRSLHLFLSERFYSAVVTKSVWHGAGGRRGTSCAWPIQCLHCWGCPGWLWLIPVPILLLFLHSPCSPCCLPTWRWIKSWQCLLTVAGILFPFPLLVTTGALPSLLVSSFIQGVADPCTALTAQHCWYGDTWNGSYINTHFSASAFTTPFFLSNPPVLPPSLLCSLYVLLYLVSTCLSHALNNSCLILCFFS